MKDTQATKIFQGPASPEQTFQRYRPLLFAICRRILGSNEEAEDIIQETYMRWARTDFEAVQSPKNLLTTIATRLCINHLNSALVRRERTSGLEFEMPAAMVMDPIQKNEALSAAFDILFETLSPVERAAFLLREVFEFSYEQIGSFIDRTPTNCRQIVKRARDRVVARIPRFSPSWSQHDRLLDAFSRSSENGDLKDVFRVLSDDILEDIGDREQFGGIDLSAQLLPGFQSMNSERPHNVLILEKLADQVGQAALDLLQNHNQISEGAFALALISSRLHGAALELEELLSSAFPQPGPRPVS